jgi:hypothetical protein
MAGVDVEAIAAKELTFAKYIELRVETGWSLGRHSGSSTDTKGDIVGPLVWAIWAIEALGLLVAGVFFGIRGTPYCETCKKDLAEQDVVTRTDLDLSDLGALTAAPSVQTLVDIPPKTQPSTVGLRVTYAMHVCNSCDGDTYLTVKSTLPAVGQRDRNEEKTLHPEVTLPRGDYNRRVARAGHALRRGRSVTEARLHRGVSIVIVVLKHERRVDRSHREPYRDRALAIDADVWSQGRCQH